MILEYEYRESVEERLHSTCSQVASHAKETPKGWINQESRRVAVTSSGDRRWSVAFPLFFRWRFSFFPGFSGRSFSESSIVQSFHGSAKPFEALKNISAWMPFRTLKKERKKLMQPLPGLLHGCATSRLLWDLIRIFFAILVSLLGSRSVSSWWKLCIFLCEDEVSYLVSFCFMLDFYVNRCIQCIPCISRLPATSGPTASQTFDWGKWSWWITIPLWCFWRSWPLGPWRHWAQSHSGIEEPGLEGCCICFAWPWLRLRGLQQHACRNLGALGSLNLQIPGSIFLIQELRIA